MKKVSYFIFILFFTACGTQSIENSDLNDLIEQRNELRTQYDELGTKIGNLEKEIAKLDTTKRKTLVTVITAQVDTFKHFFEVYGNVDVKRNALLVAESPGNVLSVNVSEGQNVSKGQVLVKLDDALVRRSIDEVETNYELARSLFERQERLWKENIGSEVQYLEAKNRKESLESTLATLQEQLAKTTIRAPFNGVVEEIMLKVGEMAGGGVPVARVLDLSEFHIEAEVPESYAMNLREGNEVEVIFPDVDTLNATITTIGSFINPNNRTFRILVDVKAQNGRFKPNQLTILRINDLSAPGSVILPSNVIQQDARGNDFVFVAEETEGRFAKVHKTSITTGKTYLDKTQVISGLTGNERIVNRGSRSIRDNQEIEITAK